MDDVEQVDLLPQGAEKYLLGAAGILPVDDAVEVGEVGGAQGGLRQGEVGQCAVPAWAQVPEHGRVDGVAGGVQELVVAGAGGQGPLVQPQAEGHRRRGGRLLGVAAGLEPAQGGQEGAPLRSPELELHQGLVLPGNVIGQAPVLQPQLVPQSALHLHPAHVGPGTGGDQGQGAAPARVLPQGLQQFGLIFQPGQPGKVVRPQALAVEGADLGGQRAVGHLRVFHGCTPTIRENRVSTQRSLFFS